MSAQRAEIACMGGWCLVRESCGHYRSADSRQPIERLCEPGGRSAWVPVIVARSMSFAPLPRYVVREEQTWR